MTTFFQRLGELEARGEDFALCTVIETGGSTPGQVAFHMAVRADGSSFGTVGGGALELQCTQAALGVLRGGEAKVVEYRLDKSTGGIGMACGGTIRVFIERVVARPRLFVFGGGHIGTALVDLASTVGFDCTVLDDRPDFATAARHPRASACATGSYDELAGARDFPPAAFYVIVTHKHAGDELILGHLLRRELTPRYVGVIGSKLKLVDMYRRLAHAGIAREALASVQAPIGIDHGGQSAEEIALAIAAELVAARHGKKLADSMKDRIDVLAMAERQLEG